MVYGLEFINENGSLRILRPIEIALAGKTKRHTSKK
jgi:hypothetical protein